MQQTQYYTQTNPLISLTVDMGRAKVLSTGTIMFRLRLFNKEGMLSIREWLRDCTFADIEPEEIADFTDVECLHVAYCLMGKDIEGTLSIAYPEVLQVR